MNDDVILASDGHFASEGSVKKLYVVWTSLVFCLQVQESIVPVKC